MKKIALLFLFLNCCLAFGQAQNQDVLYLKNGSIIKGSILEMDPTTGIKIKTTDGSLFVYKMEEILKTEKMEFVGDEVSQETTEEISQAAIEDVFTSYIAKNRSALQFIGVSKVNGIKKEVEGQQIYDIEYELIIESTAAIYVNDKRSMYNNKSFIDNFDYYIENASAQDVKYSLSKTLKPFNKGTRFLFQGTLPFEQTDNGWRAQTFSNKSYKVVSSNYMTPEMKKREAEEKARLLEELKRKLDWRRDDVASFDFRNLDLKATNVPLFDYGYSNYSLQKSENYSGRNDVLLEMQEVFYSALTSSNRYTEVESSELTSSENSGIVAFSIDKVDFTFVEAGYRCLMSISVKIQGDYKAPNEYTYEYTVPVTAQSTYAIKNYSKREAFNSALGSLRIAIRAFVFKYEPIEIEVLRIETNKRGKPTQVIFKKPEKFISARKITFLVLNPDAVKIEDKTFKITSKVGNCIFKGEIIGDEIICEINGIENRKAFIGCLENNVELIGISIY
ncbi:MAG: hypothetical protein GQ574_28345 [Crocinitomix sp.]|nr:hypothetical protein [Crocinitomix sp.]